MSNREIQMLNLLCIQLVVMDRENLIPQLKHIHKFGSLDRSSLKSSQNTTFTDYLF